jgi:hypothetical protein
MAGPRILCVDWTNDGRGPFTQAYLELLRIWFANTSQSRKWCFQDISSAGIFICSEFSRKHHTLFNHSGQGFSHTNQERSNLALSALNKQGSYDSPEKRTIMARVGNRKIRGIRASDFQKSHIICFDKPTYELIKTLRHAASNDAHGAAQLSKICLVEISSGFLEHDREMQAGKLMLQEWAMKYLNWKEPTSYMQVGYWGTKQVVVPEAGFVALRREGEKRLSDIKKATSCDFQFSAEMEDGLRVVSIVGRKDRLDLAATEVLHTW